MTHITISASSQPGLVRDHNEDTVLIATETYRDTSVQRAFDLQKEEALVVAVADGLGGHNAGEVASLDAARELGAHVAALPSVLSARELREDLERWADDEHRYLLSESENHPEQRGMGTTLVAALFYRSHCYMVNCGDSRLYLFHDGKLRQLSEDHSLYKYTQCEGDRHCITNCLGAGAESYIDFTDITTQLSAGDRLLLCSDGLTDMVEDDAIQRLLTDGGDAQALVKAAYDEGGCDNVSVIVADITPEQTSTDTDTNIETTLKALRHAS